MPAPEARVLPLELEDVSLELGGARVLEGVSLRLLEGPLSVVLGANGAGKTLLLRLCDGRIAPTRGRLHWVGAGGDRAASARAMVSQRPVLLRRSAAANVDYPLRLRGIPRAERRRRVARALASTRLAELSRRAARTLSVGEQQRLAIARAWALEPQVVFLDEPAAPLDPSATRVLEAAIRGLRRDGVKIVLSTHDLRQARRMADEVLFLHRGRLLEQTPAAAFFERPDTAEAKTFLEGEIV